MKKTKDIGLDHRIVSDQTTGCSKKGDRYSSPQLIRYGSVASVTGSNMGASALDKDGSYTGMAMGGGMM